MKRERLVITNFDSRMKKFIENIASSQNVTLSGFLKAHIKEIAIKHGYSTSSSSSSSAPSAPSSSS